MFIPVEQADCAVVLNNLMQMVESILAYPLASLFPRFDGHALETLKKQTDPSVRGLLSRKNVKKAAEKFFTMPREQCELAFLAFQNDRIFHQKINDSGFRLNTLPRKTNMALHDLCNALYESVRYGLPKKELLPREADPGEAVEYSLKMLHEQYVRANGQYGQVCPICLREVLFNGAEGQADHYFPKNRYATLILHPNNILPTCSDCNGFAYKSDKNPIDKKDIGKGELRTVFVPYLRAARPQVDFSVSVDPKRTIVMRPGLKGDEHTQRRIENLERLYGLGKRWSSIFENTVDDIKEELSEQCKTIPDGPRRLVKLRELLRKNAHSTKDRKDFVKGVYCAWLLTKSDRNLVDLLLKSSLKASIPT